ncbi:MAG: hypothetical protein J7L55_00635 [Desulfurococcales archaeon]|nr:hypothetical protein [Desulfurococcales archaeon]
MGLQVLYGLWSAITSFRVTGVASWLALAGITIIAVVAAGYGIYGLIKLGKWVASMRVKEFSILLLAIGAALVGVAVALP